MDRFNECMSFSSLSILINGAPDGLFPTHRGLRQGDPLSFLFTIVGEALSQTLAAQLERI